MRIVNNIKTFLYDKNYFINIYENKIHIFNYLDLKELSDSNIVIQMDDFSLYLKGKDLHISKMSGVELLITGMVNELRFIR